jgi:hypothetical protein
MGELFARSRFAVTDHDADVRLTVRALPGPWGPVAVRLRFLLKYALRTCGLQCVEIEEVPSGAPGTAPAALKAAKAGSGAAGGP